MEAGVCEGASYVVVSLGGDIHVSGSRQGSVAMEGGVLHLSAVLVTLGSCILQRLHSSRPGSQQAGFHDPEPAQEAQGEHTSTTSSHSQGGWV